MSKQPSAPGSRPPSRPSSRGASYSNNNQTKLHPHSHSNVEHLYYGAQALKALGADPSKSLDVCAVAESAPYTTLHEARFAASLAAMANCKHAAVLSTTAESLAHAALAAPTSVAEVHDALATLAALKAAGVKVKAPTLAAIPPLFKTLTHSTGLLRPSSATKLPTFAATGQAYWSVAYAQALGSTLSTGLEAGIAQVLKAAKPDGGLWTKGDDDALASTSLTLSGIAALKKSADAQTVRRTASCTHIQINHRSVLQRPSSPASLPPAASPTPTGW